MLHPGPELPAEASTKMPAAWVLLTMVSSGPGGAALAGRAAPTIVYDVGAQRGVGVVAAEVGGRDEELEALGVSRGSAVALVHVAAADPLGAGGHADLVARAIVAGGRAGGVGAVALSSHGATVLGPQVPPPL